MLFSLTEEKSKVGRSSPYIEAITPRNFPWERLDSRFLEAWEMETWRSRRLRPCMSLVKVLIDVVTVSRSDIIALVGKVRQ